MDHILPVHRGIFLEEAEFPKASDDRLAVHTVEIMHHATFALEAAAVDVEKTHRVAFLKSFVQTVGAEFVDVARAFVADGERGSETRSADGYKVGVTERRRSHLNQDLIRSGLRDRDDVDHRLVLRRVPLSRFHRHPGGGHHVYHTDDGYVD